ncbi:MAG: FKBP-type peptidyl-prolyl cis-trans isomerase [Cyclobacteriaceae bacterium]|jgi:FKBP-type peptidyl-prolyl cis-trans isomerase
MKKQTGWLLALVAAFLGCADDSDNANEQAEQLLLEQQQTIEQYIADNGITATRDGDIYYQTITANTSGEVPQSGDIIKIYYQIAELEGGVIDEVLASSSKPPVTYVFQTGNLILPAMDFSIAKMRVGEEYEFYLPTSYAYVGYTLEGVVPENAIIRTRIQLVDIVTEAEVRAEEDLQIKDYLSENMLTEADSLTSGVYYVLTEEGEAEGPTPADGSTVQVRYTGTLLDGTEFDSNVDADNPLSFVIGAEQVIDGFDIGVSQMQLGEKGIIIIPSLEAYAQSQLAFPSEIILDLFQRGLINSPIGAEIPPFSPLRFDIELVKVD